MMIFPISGGDHVPIVSSSGISGTFVHRQGEIVLAMTRRWRMRSISRRLTGTLNTALYVRSSKPDSVDPVCRPCIAPVGDGRTVNRSLEIVETSAAFDAAADCFDFVGL